MWRRSALALLIGSMLLGAVTVPAATDGRHRDKPSRVLILMLDQARPDTIERYDMDNVKELMRKCTSCRNYS